MLLAGAGGLGAQGLPPIPPPADIPYPGTLVLHVDATDIDRRIMTAHETIPAHPGPLALHYPKWLPGNHSPTGPIASLAGPIIRAGGRRIEWTRDPVDVYTFHLTVPADAKAIDLEFEFASAENPDQGRIVMTPEILGVQWEKVLLYPAGYNAGRIPISASVSLPAGWGYATALGSGKPAGDGVHFETVSLETLVDSPLFAGRHHVRVDLDPGSRVPIFLNVFGDSQEEIAIKPEQLAAHRRLVREAILAFGSRHFDHYDFLFSISDNFSGIGLEHHRSSEDGVRSGYFSDWDRTEWRRDLLAHEMTHSWNGKFRRPADLYTPNYNVPMGNSLLWVYEGMTQYWGYVLAARSGLWSGDLARQTIASIAGRLQEHRPGREWRDLEDTTLAPIIAMRRPLSWVSWQRTEDYYTEGALIWLDVDTRIRELSAGKRSLEDFARAFFGIDDGSYATVTYTFDDVVRGLNAVAPNDWAAFLHARLDGHGPGAPLDGIARSGWRLVFRDEIPPLLKKLDEGNESSDFSYSLGVVVDKEARLSDVDWDGPAFRAGLSTASTVVAVNGLAYKADRLKRAIVAAHTNHTPIELIVRTQDRYRTVRIDYFGGLRYPVLERVPASRDMLADILRPLGADPSAPVAPGAPATAGGAAASGAAAASAPPAAGSPSAAH